MNYQNKPPLPVDIGWAWFIMIGTYIIILIIVSCSRFLAIFLPDILDHYKEPTTVTTLAFGISDVMWSVTNILIPTVLLPRFSVRTLVLCGAFAHCLGVIGLAYSPNIIMFNCIFGILGVAAGLTLVPSIIHMGHFFKRKLSFANAVAHVGGSTATIFVPRLAQFLKDVYGYQGAILILGGISLHCVAAALLFRPLSMFNSEGHTKSTPHDSYRNTILKPSDIDPTHKEIHFKSKENEDAEVKEDEINEESKFIQIKDLNNAHTQKLSDQDMRNWSDVKRLQLEDKNGLTNNEWIPLSGTTFTKSTSQSIHKQLQNVSSLLPDLPTGLPTHSHSESNIQITQAASNLNGSSVSKLTSSDTRQNHEDSAKPGRTDACVHGCSLEEDECNQTVLIQETSQRIPDSTASVTPGNCSRMGKIRDYLATSVVLNPVAVMLIVAGGLNIQGGNMYLPVLGLENGLSTDEVPWMLTIVGVSDIVGKLGIGFYADLGYLRPVRIVCITEFILGMVCQFTMFYKGFGPMAGMSVIYGIMNGFVGTLLTPMVIEMLGLPYLAQVLSIVYLMNGVFTFILNVSVGAIKDATGYFFGGFNFLGGMLLTSLVVLLLEPLFVRCRDKLNKHRKNSTSGH